MLLIDRPCRERASVPFRICVIAGTPGTAFPPFWLRPQAALGIPRERLPVWDVSFLAASEIEAGHFSPDFCQKIFARGGLRKRTARTILVASEYESH